MGMSGARRLATHAAKSPPHRRDRTPLRRQGIELLAPLQTGTLAKKAVATVRAVSPKVVEDRPLSPDIESITAKIADGTFSTILR